MPSTASPALEPNETPLLHIAARKLQALTEAIGQPEIFGCAIEGVSTMMEPCGGLPVARGPYWPSDLTDDGSPFEFSLAFRGSGVDLRFLNEPQSIPVTNESNWEAGLLLNERLSGRHGADLSQFNQIKELFAPIASIPARFLLWHSAVFHGNGSPTMFKVYVNPQVVGVDAAPRLVERALHELGLEHAWRFLVENVDAASRFVYFSLDLVARELARVKVYSAHVNTSGAEIANRVHGVANGIFGDTASLLETLTGNSGPFSARPILSCYSFQPERPDPQLTLHVPVRCYVADDREAVDRVCTILTDREGATLRRAVASIAARPLESGRGLVTYVSLRPERSGRCVTVYLSPELYATSHPKSSSVLPTSEMPKVSMIRDLKPSSSKVAFTLEDVQAAVASHQQILSLHPFLSRLEGKPSLEQTRLVARRLAFFVMCFQDVLRLTHRTMTDPEIKKIAKLHALEDAGHDHWYLHDLARFGIACDVGWLFSEDHEKTRDVAYSQIADVLRSADDRSRLAVALSLEAAGSEFFRRMIDALERLGQADGLKYFARAHERVEQGHEIFDAATRESFRRISVPNDAVNEVLGVVERTFASMTQLADDLESALAAMGSPDCFPDRKQNRVA
jgi:DMATS type aromatic prenyltransferase